MAQLRNPVTSADHVIGDDSAAVTIVEYGDYECPFCASAHPIVKQVLARHGRNLRFVFRHFPLVEMHPNAEPAAETAEFAGTQGLFWPMHDAIYANQPRLNIPLLISLAAGLKLSTVALRDALAQQRFAPKIQADFAGGVRSGVNGTPAFFINGMRLDHPLGAAALPAAIDATLQISSDSARANSPSRVTFLRDDGPLLRGRTTRIVF
jgi:protein-disulfide isomerase